jgi:hypothetical protein
MEAYLVFAKILDLTLSVMLRKDDSLMLELLYPKASPPIVTLFLHSNMADVIVQYLCYDPFEDCGHNRKKKRFFVKTITE